MHAIRTSSGSRMPRPARRAALTPFLLVTLIGLLAILALVINVLFVSSTQLESQTDAEAAALAGMQAFLDDQLLLGDPTMVVERMAEARRAAQAQAARNYVRGRPLLLDGNLTNQNYGDVVFGRLDAPRSQVFVTAPVDVTSPDPQIVTMNAIRVRADQSQSHGTAVALFLGPLIGQGTIDVRDYGTALFDRDVVGFRPWGVPNVPMVPLAVFSDPTGTGERSWQYQVELMNGTDDFAFDRLTKSFAPGSDSLHEMELLIALDAAQLADANVTILNLGATDGTKFASQVTDGISGADLAGVGGQILLDDMQQELLPGEEVGPPEGSGDLDLLRAALDTLRARGEARVWPLYTSFNAITGEIQVTGFVAARVVEVGAVNPGRPLRVVLQPAVMASSTALTDAARRMAGTASVNPYVGKIRVVE